MTKITHRTLTKLDRGLRWNLGTAAKILAGTATPTEIAEVVPRVHERTGGAGAVVAGSGRAELGGLNAHATGQVRPGEARVADAGIGTDEVSIERVTFPGGTLRFRAGERVPPRSATIITVTELLGRLRAEQERTPSMDAAEDALLRLLPELYGRDYPATAAAQRLAAEESERRKRAEDDLKEALNESVRQAREGEPERGRDDEVEAEPQAPKGQVEWRTEDAPSARRAAAADERRHSAG